MNTIDNLSHNFKDTLGSISDGWQHLWQKARNAITYFSPAEESEVQGEPPVQQRSRWGVLQADVKEMDKNIEVQLESPGMDSGDFEIKVDRQILIVRGTKSYRSDHKEGRFHFTERAFGSFERLIPIPCAVIEDEASAKYKDGVLFINLPKRQEAAVKQIAIK